MRLIEQTITEGRWQARLTLYLQDNSAEIAPQRKRPVVLICPGGGYEFLSEREAEPVALRFLSLGFQAAVLQYSVKPAVFPTALRQLAQAVAALRRHAEAWLIDPQQITVMGFSAGGHLAASLGTFWNCEVLADLEQKGSVKPDSLILSYPVISSGAYAHKGSIQALLGAAYEDKKATVSLERAVTSTMPPTFLWHTVNDDDVPAKNSLLLADALFEAQVPFEFHLFNRGQHGLALASRESQRAQAPHLIVEEIQNWPELATRWLQDLYGGRLNAE